MSAPVTLLVDVSLLDAVVCGPGAVEGPWCEVVADLPLGRARPRHVAVTAAIRAWREFCVVCRRIQGMREPALRLHAELLRVVARRRSLEARVGERDGG